MGEVEEVDMGVCSKCGTPLGCEEHLFCIECDPSIQEGSTVKQEFLTTQGIAFTRNSKGQWLVKWDDGRVDVVHENYLKKVAS